MPPANILYVNTPEITGGAEISLLTAMVNLDPARYRVSLVTTPGSTLIEQARAVGIEPHVMEFPWLSRRRPWPYLNSILGLVRLIRQLDIDLVHTNCDHSLPYVRKACRLVQRPYVSHVRDFVRGWFREPYFTGLKGAERVIANSRAVADECIRHGVIPERVVTVYNPVDLERFQPLGDDLREELCILPDAQVVGIVGQIHEIKGYREFLDAVLEIAPLIPNVAFLLVGRPPDEAGRELENELKARIAASSFSEAFHLVGYRKDIDRVMRTIDILTIPSWAEPFGRVAVEAMATGKAVIGTNIGGLLEIIQDKKNGLLIPPRDAGAIRDAVRCLLIDPNLRLQLGAEGRTSVGRFSIDHHLNCLSALYDEVIHQKKSSGG